MKFKKVRIYNTSNPYIHNLSPPLYNVKNVTIRKALIYNTGYLINNNNNKFYYNSTYVTLNNGNYTSSELITELNNKLSSIITSITYDNKTYKFTFNFNTNVNLLFTKMEQLSLILGFNNIDRNNINTLTSDFTARLNSTPFYLLYIDKLSNNDENPYTSYDVIYNNLSYGNLLIYEIRDKLDFDEINYSNLNLQSLKIEIKDYLKNTVDFNNMPYLLEFDIYYE